MYQNFNSKELTPFRKFCITGKLEDYQAKIDYLSELTDNEYWDMTDYQGTLNNYTLHHYIHHSFNIAFKNQRIWIDDKGLNAFYNTGLLSKKGEMIYTHFIPSGFYQNENPESPYWFLKGFIEESHNDMKLCKTKPTPNEFNQYYSSYPMNMNKPIEIDFDHFYDDHSERLPSSLTQLNKKMAKAIFEQFLNESIQRLKSSYRLSLMTLHYDTLNHIFPVFTFDGEVIILVLEETETSYYAKTILTPAMAYNNARIFGKVDSLWLLDAVRKG